MYLEYHFSKKDTSEIKNTKNIVQRQIFLFLIGHSFLKNNKEKI